MRLLRNYCISKQGYFNHALVVQSGQKKKLLLEMLIDKILLKRFILCF